jgi:UDP-sugar transporter A1/2/3
MQGGFISYALLLLLALQYGLQPFLTARYLAAAGCDARAVVLVTELVKAALCAASLAAQPPARRARRELWRAAAPAGCYLVQNLAMQQAYADLDSLTFNCLNQTKLVATALFLYVLLRQRQTPQQLLALAMLVAAGALLQATGEQRATKSASAPTANFQRGVLVRAQQRLLCATAVVRATCAVLCVGGVGVCGV